MREEAARQLGLVELNDDQVTFVYDQSEGPWLSTESTSSDPNSKVRHALFIQQQKESSQTLREKNNMLHLKNKQANKSKDKDKQRQQDQIKKEDSKAAPSDVE